MFVPATCGEGLMFTCMCTALTQEYAAVLMGMSSFSPSSFIIDELWLTDLLTMIQVRCRASRVR